MRLKSIFISEYKNFKNFNFTFEQDNFLEVFVGKNGSGKSNLFEALLEIFRHIYESEIRKARNSFAPNFSYKINYLIGEETITAEYDGTVFLSNFVAAPTAKLMPFPDNFLIYYSGQNKNITELLEKYEASFRRNIDKTDEDDSRIFIGIGPDYKHLLLTIMTLLPHTNIARQFVYGKLGLNVQQESLILILTRPRKSYAKDVVIDEFDPTTHYWGLKGSSKTFVKRLEKCIKGEFNHRDLYTASAQAYLLNIDIKLFRNEFSTEDAGVLFRYFDNLKTLEMLATIEADLSLIDGGKADLNYFSDGQFQSVYIYSITEIFKNSNSITLLDEPDSFLHPEWQFEFLSQISEISEQAIKTNQVFMTSHSAATLMSAPSPQLNSLQVCDNGSTEISLVSKFDVIKRLSGNKIFLDENESIMNISTFVKNSTQPVLFTEGISDEYILGVAWKKLYPGVNRPFCIHNAFDRGFLRNLFIRNELRNSFPERTLFALFDFDDAYEDWKVLSKGGITEIDNPFNGLTTKMKHEYHYAMLLPVPNVAAVKKQVLKADDTPWGKGTESHLAIELLFFNENLVGTWFDKKATSGGGEIIKFKSDKLKVKFAEEFVPSLLAVDFEIFRPMFEFIVAKTNTVDTELAVLEAS